MKVKIVDVAREANVSVATVSRVVNNIPLVNEETKERVLEAIKKTGYKPNAIARSLKIQRTDTLGIMIPDISNPLYTEMVRGVEDICSIYNYNIILSNTDFSSEQEQKSLDVLIEKQCDGIIYIGKNLTEEFQETLKTAPSEVVLGCVMDEKGELSSVLIDNENAAYDLTKKAIDSGYRNFAVFSDREDGFVARKRLDGIKRALDEAGIAIDPDLVMHGNINVKGGHSMMTKLLETGKDVDIAMCLNDQVAIGAIRAAQDAGKRVPEDIAVTGFNDYWISEWISPKITTVSQPMYDIGAIAARMLIKMCQSDEKESKTITVPYEIVIRESMTEKNQ
ncbi:MAG: LacI family DNA-binding transcriptional regulator [Eubacteriaceae bacterium]|jgi:LacI family transcriptional regulator